MAKISDMGISIKVDAAEALTTLDQVIAKAKEARVALEAVKMLQPYLRDSYYQPFGDPSPVRWEEQSLSHSARPGQMETWRPGAVSTGHGFWIPVVLHFVTKSDVLMAVMNTIEHDPAHTKASRQAAMEDAWGLCVLFHQEAQRQQ